MIVNYIKNLVAALYFRYLEDFKNCPASDAKGLIRAIENLVPEMYVYKGAEFWKDAALTYLRNDVLKIDQHGKNKKWLSRLLSSPPKKILTSGTFLLCSVLAFLYIKKKYVK